MFYVLSTKPDPFELRTWIDRSRHSTEVTYPTNITKLFKTILDPLEVEIIMLRHLSLFETEQTNLLRKFVKFLKIASFSNTIYNND